MASTIYYKTGDRVPAVRANLLQAGSPIDLTAVGSVTLRLVNKSTNEVKLSAGACTVVTASQGLVQYAWGANDLDTAGEYAAEFHLIWAGGNQTVPSDSTFTVVVISRL